MLVLADNGESGPLAGGSIDWSMVLDIVGVGLLVGLILVALLTALRRTQLRQR
jgi:hypothetical protein